MDYLVYKLFGGWWLAFAIGLAIGWLSCGRADSDPSCPSVASLGS